MSAIKDVYDIIKELKGLVEEYQDAKMSEKLIEIQSCFFDIREEMDDIKDENKELKEQIKRMNDNSELEKDLQLEPQGFYIRKSDTEGGNKYCVACWQNHKKLMPLSKSIGRSLHCVNCDCTIIL